MRFVQIRVPVMLAAAAASGAMKLAAQSGVEIRDSLGVEIVDNRVPAWKNGKGWAIDPTPAVSIGSEDDPHARFSRIVMALLVGDTAVVVSDAKRASLTVFGRGGRYLATIGQSGGGPGEFSHDPMTVVRRNDTILVWDGNHQRVSWFSLAGELLGERRFDRLSPMVVKGLRGDGTLLAVEDVVKEEHPRGRPGVHDRIATVRLLASSGATIIDFGMLAVRRSVLRVAGSYGKEDAFVQSRFILRTGPNPLAIPDWQRREIREYLGAPTSSSAYGRDGKLGRIVRIAVRREPTPASYRNIQSKIVPADEIPDSLAAIADVFADSKGNLWLGRMRLPSDGGVHSKQPEKYDVIDTKGRWLGTVDIPEGLGKVLDIGDHYILMVTRNEDDVPIVRKHRIVK